MLAPLTQLVEAAFFFILRRTTFVSVVGRIAIIAAVGHKLTGITLDPMAWVRREDR
jgi:hypothetical protein